ncbi:MAG: glycosyltransferase [SAR324 cluster bacterium]|nr:glycosyltransferase [SAR324 cluster bacterium]
MLHFLYMSHIAPYPIRGGEKIRASGLIRMLSNLGTVDSIVEKEGLSDLPSTESLPNVRFHPFNFLSEMKPVVRYFFKNHALVQHIGNILEHHPIDLAVIDYQFYGKYIGFFQAIGIPVIYGTHNAEALLTEQEIRYHSGKKALEKRILSKIQAHHERLYFPKADAFIVVSRQDEIYYQRWIDPQKIVLIPNFLYPQLYPETGRPPPAHNPRKLVMTGNFSVFQNLDGFRWFLQEIWHPFRLFESFELLLVGRGSEEALEKVCCRRFPPQNIRASGTVDSILEQIEDAMASLVPIRYGSGTRLKVLEAMWQKIPVISTSLGVEGIEGESNRHFLVADDPKTFAEQLSCLNSPETRERLVENATNLLHQKYTLAANQKRFLEFISARLPACFGREI